MEPVSDSKEFVLRVTIQIIGLMNKKTYFLNCRYHGKHIDQEFSRVIKISREKALNKSAKRHIDYVPFIMKWDNLSLPNANAVIRRTLVFYILSQRTEKFSLKSLSRSAIRGRKI